MRRLVLLASAIVFLDVAFYAALVPLLPDYVDRLDLSKAEAGILSAAYAAGTLAAALPAGFVAARFGPRRTVLAGLGLLAASSFTFGFANHIVLLDAARLVQGIAGALMWSGAFTWLILSAPEDRRGGVIGTAIGTAVAGALFGPPLGALANAIGTRAVFGSVVAVAAVLAWFAARSDDPTERETQGLREVWRTLRSRPVLLAAGFVAAPSALFGVDSVIVPLRLDELGGGPVTIASGFTIGAGLEAIMAPIVGRYSDRRGRLAPYVTGALVAAASIVVVGTAMLQGLIVAAVITGAVGAGFCFTPATAMLSDAAEATGLHQGYAAGLLNAAWAGGQVLGAVGGGAGAELAGSAAPCIAAAALLVLSAGVAWRSVPLLSRAPASA
jgi:predicted MFS family arabinose efflux permease